MKLTIALIGVGLMGAPYAQHLVADGHRVRLFNRTRARAEAIDGAEVFDSPREAAAKADVLISVLANDATALEALEPAVFQALADGAVHLSCSTLSVDATLELAKRAREEGKDHLSCPFLGRPEVVAQRAHQFLLSGHSSRREAVLELLNATSKGVVDFGERAEAAVLTKLATNSLIASAITSMSESFALLEKAGISTDKAYELWTASMFDCPLYKAYGKKVKDATHDNPSFALKLALKDVNLVRSAAGNLGTSCEVISAIGARFEKSVAAGDGELDFTGVARLIRQESGL